MEDEEPTTQGCVEIKRNDETLTPAQTRCTCHAGRIFGHKGRFENKYEYAE